MWGQYCCGTLKEDNSTVSLVGCNGGEISLGSICCEKNIHYKCPHDKGCTDNKDRGTSHIKLKLLLKSKQYQYFYCSSEMLL